MKSLRQAFSFLALVLLLTGASPAWSADPCLLDGVGARSTNMNDCSKRASANGDTTNASTGFPGARVNAGLTAITPLDLFNVCRYVDNASGHDYFVPFNNATEWNAFLHALPAGVTTRHCARPYSEADVLYGPTDAQSGDDGEKTHLYESLPLPYWPTSAEWPPAGTATATHTFTNTCHYQESVASPTCRDWVVRSCQSCDKNGNCTTYSCSYCRHQGTICQPTTSSWSQTFDLQFSALDSDTSTPSWSWTSTKTAGPARPNICNTICTDNGLECICDGVVPDDPVCNAWDW